MSLKLLTLPVAVVLLLLVGGLVWLPMTPEYTVAHVMSAATESDYTEMVQYVDMDSVVQNVVEPGTTAPKKPEPAESGIEKVVDRIGQGIMMMIKPKITRNVKQEVQTEVEAGRFAQYHAGNPYLLAVKFITDTHEYIHIRNKQRTGNLLKLDVYVNGPNAGHVTLKLSRSDARWIIKAVEPTDIPQLIDLGLS